MQDASVFYMQLHRIPELSGQEFMTAQYIEKALVNMGYSPKRIGTTGVYADQVTDPALPWLMFRADMDALPIQENSCVSYPSENRGVMHACGHDTHCAMLLSAAHALKGSILPQNIRFLFQPAEETTQGAEEMIAGGVIPEKLLACFAMHVWPGVPEGVVTTKPGTLMASSDVFRIEIHGKSAHCAQSQLGADALQTAVDIATQLPVLRAKASDENTILFCGSIHSGSSHNIVADEACLRGTLRTYSAHDRLMIKAVLEQQILNAAGKFGTQAKLIWESGCPAVCNDTDLIKILQKLEPKMRDTATPTLAAEDFACYQQYAPGVMLWLGTGDTPPLHNEAFYVPEKILSKGVALWHTIAAHDWKGDVDYARKRSAEK